LNASPVRETATSVAGVRQSFAADSASITQPNAIERSIEQVLQAVRETLLKAWARHVSAPPDDRLADTLAAVPNLAAPADRLRRLHADLRRAAERLPANDAGVRQPEQLRLQVRELIRALRLSNRVLALLERARDRGGIPLSELLADELLLVELQTLHILECLRVVI
jgi:hypothetical protein